MIEVEKLVYGGDCKGGFMHIKVMKINKHLSFCRESSIVCIEDRVVVDRTI